MSGFTVSAADVIDAKLSICLIQMFACSRYSTAQMKVNNMIKIQNLLFELSQNEQNLFTN